MTDIDPVRFGELIQAMRALERQLEATAGDVRVLEERLVSLEGGWRMGRGWVFGLVVGLGFAVLGVKHTLAGLFEVLK